MLKRKFFYWLTISNFLYIIVLLILAGVTIATLTGDNGILSKATQAKEQTEVATEKEQVEIAYMSADMNKTGEVVTVEELQAELDKMAKTLVSDNGDGTFNVFFEDSKNNYKVENGAVSETVLTEEKMNLEKGSIQIIDKQTNEIMH